MTESGGWTSDSSPMCTTYFKQHIHDLSGCDVSSTCTCRVCLRQHPFLNGTTFYIVLNCVHNLDKVQLLCNATFHQYFDVLLTVHLSIILVINQPNAPILVL